MVYRTSAATQERKDAKRRHIVETAAKVFAARGYTGTTVKDIVTAAEVSVGSFYFYFESKEQIFAALYDAMSDLMNEHVDWAVEGPDQTVSQRFTRATVACLKVYEERKELARIMMIEATGVTPIFQEKIAEKAAHSRQRTEALLTRLSDKGLVKVADARVSAIAFEGTFQTVVTDWLWSQKETGLIKLAFPLSVFNLQALGIPFTAEEVRHYIQDYLANPPTGRVPPQARSKRKTR